MRNLHWQLAVVAKLEDAESLELSNTISVMRVQVPFTAKLVDRQEAESARKVLAMSHHSMNEPLPKFDNPPVIETVLGAQFERLAKFRTAHTGCFWQQYLRGDWTKIEETFRLDDQFERFGDDRKWGPAIGFSFKTSTETQRTQIIRSDDARMIQIQDSRFIYNWKRIENSAYPTFEKTEEEFSKWYHAFREFVPSLDVGEITENQWEVVYVSHVTKGTLWDSPRDWVGIFPWLLLPFPKNSVVDSVIAEWGATIGEDLGRLRSKLSYGRVSPEGPEALILELTARGPIKENAAKTVADGLKIGHECIVRSFAEMTSSAAHKYWERRE